MDMQKSGEIETWNNLRGFPWINAIISQQNDQDRATSGAENDA